MTPDCSFPAVIEIETLIERLIEAVETVCTYIQHLVLTASQTDHRTEITKRSTLLKFAPNIARITSIWIERGENR